MCVFGSGFVSAVTSPVQRETPCTGGAEQSSEIQRAVEYSWKTEMREV